MVVAHIYAFALLFTIAEREQAKGIVLVRYVGMLCILGIAQGWEREKEALWWVVLTTEMAV